MGKKLRLQKILAATGKFSRRKAEEAIQAGRVSVDGETVTEMGIQIDPEGHQVAVDGVEIVTVETQTTLLLHKPTRSVSTKFDPEGRRTVMDLLPKEFQHLHPVGRLDYQTEGLLLLTNDGDLTLRLTHPRYGVEKEYIAVVSGELSDERIRRLQGRIRLEDGPGAFKSLTIMRNAPKRSRLKIVVNEGRNRFVRRMLEAVELEVLELKRIRIGPLALGSLRPTQWRALQSDELKQLEGAIQEGSTRVEDE